MNVQVIIKDPTTREVNNIENATSRNEFYYKDSYGAYNHIKIEDETVKIKRITKEHHTNVCLRKDNGYVEISSDEGNFKINLKIVAFNIKDDMITIAYNISEDIREITIKYLGV